MRTFRIPLLVAAVAAATLLTACGDKNGGDNQASGNPSPSYQIGDESLTDADVSPSPSVTPEDNGSGGNNNGGGNNNNGGGEQEWHGPTIDYFRVKQHPTCPSGTDANYVEGKPVVLEWKVTGTDMVSLSVDGPGKYGDYGAEHQIELSFPCGDWQPGQKAKHTYLLQTIGGGDVAKKTITATATVNELTKVLPPSSEPDAD